MALRHPETMKMAPSWGSLRDDAAKGEVFHWRGEPAMQSGLDIARTRCSPCGARGAREVDCVFNDSPAAAKLEGNVDVLFDAVWESFTKSRSRCVCGAGATTGNLAKSCGHSGPDARAFGTGRLVGGRGRHACAMESTGVLWKPVILESKCCWTLSTSSRCRDAKWPIGVFAVSCPREHRSRAGREAGGRARFGRADDPASCDRRSCCACCGKVRTLESEHAREFLAHCAELRIAITAVFGGFEGESYADIPTTERTVGLAPPETRAARTAEMKEIADFAARLGILCACRVFALHVGVASFGRADDPASCAVEEGPHGGTRP